MALITSFFIAYLYQKMIKYNSMHYLGIGDKMIEFIVCDDDKYFVSKVENAIDKIMIKKDMEYRIIKFNDYNEKFIKYISSKENRVYILDIETPSRSGIEIARLIRRRDSESFIIFLTGHEELGPLLFRLNLNSVSLINKFDDFQEILNTTINGTILHSVKKKYLEVTDRRVIYRLGLDTILYVTRDSVERKTLIYTNNGIHKVNKSLIDIASRLDSRFAKTYRSCYVNMQRVSKVDFKNKSITFDTNAQIGMLSIAYKDKKGVILNVV